MGERGSILLRVPATAAACLQLTAALLWLLCMCSLDLPGMLLLFDTSMYVSFVNILITLAVREYS